MRESEIEAYLVKRAEEAGALVRKVQWVNRDGAPDRLLMFPERVVGGAAARTTFWVELKALGGAAKFPSNPHERQQQREHERMRAHGQHVVVLDSTESVDYFLEQFE
jgi:hypothetical protein